MVNFKDLWFKTDDKIRFLIIGCINAGISYLLYVLFVYLLGEKYYQVCAFLQWTISTVPSYLNQKFFVFCTKGNYLKEYIKCCSTWALSYFLNVIILEVLVRYIIKNVFISQFVSLFLVSVLTYVLFKCFAFKKADVEKLKK